MSAGACGPPNAITSTASKGWGTFLRRLYWRPGAAALDSSVRTPTPDLAARLGQLRHRHGDGNDLPAAAALPDARARRGSDVARRDRGRGRSGEQRAQDRRGPPVGSHGRAEGASCSPDTRISGAVRPLIALVSTWTQVLGLRFADRLGKGHPRRATRRDARALRAARPARPRLRISSRHGSRRRRARTVDRFAVPLRVPGSIPHAVRADASSPASSSSRFCCASRTCGSRERPAQRRQPRADGQWTASKSGRYANTLARRVLQSNRRHLSVQPRQRERRVPAAAPERSRHRGDLDPAPLVGAARASRSSRRWREATVGSLRPTSAHRRGLDRLCRRVRRVRAGSNLRATLVAIFLVYGVYFGLTGGVEKAWIADLDAGVHARLGVRRLQRRARHRAALREPDVRRRSGRACRLGGVLHRRRRWPSPRPRCYT